MNVDYARLQAEFHRKAREHLLSGLMDLDESHREFFKLMYGIGRNERGRPIRSVDAAKAMSIEAVVEEVRPEQLDGAMQQVQNSLNKRARRALTGVEEK